MREPIGNRNASNASNRHGKKSKDNYCWTFNKNKCNNGANCPHEHRCLYCDGWGHGLFNCFKLNKRNSSGNNYDGGSHNNHHYGNNGYQKKHYSNGNGHHESPRHSGQHQRGQNNNK